MIQQTPCRQAEFLEYSITILDYRRPSSSHVPRFKLDSICPTKQPCYLPTNIQTTHGVQSIRLFHLQTRLCHRIHTHLVPPVQLLKLRVIYMASRRHGYLRLGWCSMHDRPIHQQLQCVSCTTLYGCRSLTTLS